MKLITIVCTIILSAAFAFRTSAEETADKLLFTVTSLKTRNCPQNIGNNFAAIIRNILAKEKSFDILDSPVSPDQTIISACEEGDCSSGPVQKFFGRILITGTITQVEFNAGEKKISKYASKDIIGGKYKTVVYVINTSTGKTELIYKKAVDTDDILNLEAKKTGNEIKKYYLIKLPVPAVPGKKELPPVMEKKSEPLFKSIDLELAPSVIFPVGKYSKIADYGIGIETGLNGNVAGRKSFYLAPGLGLYYLNPAHENIKSVYMLSPHIDFGYNFPLNGSISISPYISAGYVFQLIKADKNATQGSTESSYHYKNKLYFNPSAGFGLEASYAVTEKYHAILGASYQFYASSDSLSQFFIINLGIRISW
jgi:hypothetical protein